MSTDPASCPCPTIAKCSGVHTVSMETIFVLETASKYRPKSLIVLMEATTRIELVYTVLQFYLSRPY
jgi:hypothetical protein